MILRNVIFQLEVIKQRLPAGLVSRDDQVSKANREQHRVLWPAYNPNLKTRQASTEGLFQQTRLVFVTYLRPNSPGLRRRGEVTVQLALVAYLKTAAAESTQESTKLT